MEKHKKDWIVINYLYLGTQGAKLAKPCNIWEHREQN